jgi:hypothetical protein
MKVTESNRLIYMTWLRIKNEQNLDNDTLNVYTTP